MITNNFLKTSILSTLLTIGLCTTGCKSDDTPNQPPSIANTKYYVGADVGDENYFLTTDNISSGKLTVVGNGYEGYGALVASVDGYLYIINNTESLIEKFELTENGPVKVDALSSTALTAKGFFRFIKATDNNDLFVASNPDDKGIVPYAIIDIASFEATKTGYLEMPDVDGKPNIWNNSVIQNGKIYFGSIYGNPDWTGGLLDALVTVVYDYPSLTNPVVLKSNASAGQLAGFRTNGSFATENGDIYQYNITSPLYLEHDEAADKPSVFVKISNGDYDVDYVLDVTAHYGEEVSIWNAWYAGNGIAYANIIKAADVSKWKDIFQNTGKLVEINLYNKTITELNLPDATYVNVHSLNCIVDGKFYVPVNIAGGDANIYEINIGGGANGFTKGATLDGSNVFVNTLLKNY